MDLHIGFGLTCVFTAEVFNKDGIVSKTDPFNNTVLDVGLLSLYDYSIADMALFVNVGEGANPVTIDQTGLQKRLYSCNTVFNDQEYTYYSPYPVYQGYKRVVQFPIGTVTGIFTEVGISRLSNSEYLNRQLFKNADGDYIAVRVKQDEGLRITCDLRLYPQKDTKVYSQIYRLSLNQATSGSVVFKSNNVEKEITLADLNIDNTAKLKLEQLTGISSIANYIINTDDCIILCHPLNESSINLSISSHTLTGGIGDPSLVEAQLYTNLKKEVFCPIDNRTTGLDSIDKIPAKTYWSIYCSGMNLTTMKLSEASGSQFSQWFYLPNNNNNVFENIMKVAFKNINPAVISGPGNGVIPISTFTKMLKIPALLDYSFKKKCYYAPGAIGLGNQQINGITCIYNTNKTPVLSIIAFDYIIMLPEEEELTFDLIFSWDRYIA